MYEFNEIFSFICHTVLKHAMVWPGMCRDGCRVVFNLVRFNAGDRTGCAVVSIKMNGEEETWKELDAEFDRCVVDVKPHVLKLQHRSGKYGKTRAWRNTNNSILPYC